VPGPVCVSRSFCSLRSIDWHPWSLNPRDMPAGDGSTRRWL